MLIKDLHRAGISRRRCEQVGILKIDLHVLRSDDGCTKGATDGLGVNAAIFQENNAIRVA